MAEAMQTGAAKYVSGVGLLGHRNLASHAEVLEEESLLSNCRAGDDLDLVFLVLDRHNHMHALVVVACGRHE